ncbi:MAG: hypothetical protein JXR64_06345 [Spirochaetales bacterium]|nr:hypothetical protein [Spirochaetales bacterium]
MNTNWFNQSIFYHIYPLGFCGCPEKNNYTIDSIETLLKIEEWIPHIKSLGIDALYLGPLFESESHGYDTVDYYSVDRRLGSNETLKRVIKSLHSNGLKVVLDGVFNHTSRDFFAFKDIIANRENSRYLNWYREVSFNNGIHCYCWNGHNNLPAFNLQNEEVLNYLMGVVDFWVKEFDLDGIRLDVADVLDFGFMKRLSSHVKTVKEDFWLMGEVIHGDYSHWVKPEILHSTTNYECYKGMYSSFNDTNFFEIAYSLKRQFNTSNGIYKNLNLYNFVDNHDVNRIASTLKNSAHIYPLHILMYTVPGIPSIYYGSEWGIEGNKDNNKDSVVRPNLNLDNMSRNYSRDLIKTIQQLSYVWHVTDALKYGNYNEVFVSSDCFAFTREYDNKKVLVVINSSFDEKNPGELANYKGFDILNNENIRSVNVSPSWGRVVILD